MKHYEGKDLWRYIKHKPQLYLSYITDNVYINILEYVFDL